MTNVAFTLADLVGSGCDVEYHLVSPNKLPSLEQRIMEKKGALL